MTSTADISFMLLIFFLLTTSMDADRGLLRQLPPLDDDSRQVQVDVARGHVLALTVDAEGRIAANGQLVGADELRVQAADFILAEGQAHLITVETDPSTPYEAYFMLQNAIDRAYHEAREQWTRQRFGRPLAACTADEQAEALAAFPHRVAEQADMSSPQASLPSVKTSRSSAEASLPSGQTSLQSD